jgi:hypothetical protein
VTGNRRLGADVGASAPVGRSACSVGGRIGERPTAAQWTLTPTSGIVTGEVHVIGDLRQLHDAPL